MGKVKFNMGEIKKNAQSLADRKEGGGGGAKVPYMKLGAKLSKILILPPKKKDQLIKRILVHQVWKGKKPIKTATCPRIKEGEDCKVCQRGFDLKSKYEDSGSKRKQNLWRNYMPSDSTVCNALDLEEKKPTPKVLRMPNLVFKTLVEELNESEDGSDIFDLDKGRPLIVKGNGKEGNNRRYESVRFSKNAANLVSDGKVDEDEILDNMCDLDKLLPKVSEEKLNEVFLLLKKQEQSTLSGDDEDEDDDSDDEDDDEPKSKKKSNKSKKDDDEDEDDDEVDSDDADDDEDDDFEDDDEDEKPAKKSKGKKKAEDDDDADDEDDDGDLDDDDEDDDSDSDDEDDDEDEEPAKKVKLKAGAKKAAATKKTKLTKKK